MLDKTDSFILQKLQSDGRLSNVDLAEQINLSASPCLRRVKALESEGYITGYSAKLDRKKAGFAMTVFIEVRLNSHSSEAIDVFEECVLNLGNIISAYLVSGFADYRLEAVAEDLTDYERILKEVQNLPFVKGIQSNFAIRAIKADAPLPLSKG